MFVKQAHFVVVWLVVTAAMLISPVRGQTFNFFLEGSQETPPVDSAATGRCMGVLNQSEKTFTITCTHNVSAVTEAHIHIAPVGEPGPIVFPFDDPSSPIEATWNLTDTDIVNLVRGDLYVNVHSTSFPDGEIRGQIANAETVFNILLEGIAEVPHNLSRAKGHCQGVLGVGHKQFTVECEHNLIDAFGSHIHRGAPDVDGPIIFGLGDPASPIQAVWNPTQVEVNDLFAGNLYVNVHTPNYPGGEIRGQLMNSELVFRFDMDALQEVPPNFSPATGRCLGTLAEGHNAFDIICAHSVSQPIAAHIFEGPPGVIGDIIFPLGDPISPIEATWFLSSDNVHSMLAGDLYVNVHSPTFPRGEIRGVILRIYPAIVSHLAQFGNGGGHETLGGIGSASHEPRLISDLVVTNSDPFAEVSGTAEFRDDAGNATDPGVGSISPEDAGQVVGSRVDFTVAPRGVVTISTDGLGEVRAGSLRLLTNGPVGAVVRFQIEGVGIAGVGVSPTGRGFIIPVRRVEGGINTGVAVQSASTVPIEVRFTLRDESGEQVENGVAVIDEFPAFGHIARFINELFEEADTTNFTGTLTIEAVGGEIAGTALELDAAAQEFTTLPVTLLGPEGVLGRAQ